MAPAYLCNRHGLACLGFLEGQNPCYLGRLDPPHGLLSGGSFDRASNQAPARPAVELHRHVVLEELADFAIGEFADSHGDTSFRWHSRPAARQVSFEHSAGMPKRKAPDRGLLVSESPTHPFHRPFSGWVWPPRMRRPLAWSGTSRSSSAAFHANLASSA